MSSFKEFILRGNVLDLAVAVIIGAAFSGIIDSISKDIITPLIGLMGGQPDFSSLKIGPIGVGNFINAVISFLIKALVVYCAIVKPFTTMLKLFGPEKKEEKPSTLPEVELLTEIRDLLKHRQDIPS